MLDWDTLKTVSLANRLANHSCGRRLWRSFSLFIKMSQSSYAAANRRIAFIMADTRAVWLRRLDVNFQLHREPDVHERQCWTLLAVLLARATNLRHFNFIARGQPVVAMLSGTQFSRSLDELVLMILDRQDNVQDQLSDSFWEQHQYISRISIQTPHTTPPTSLLHLEMVDVCTVAQALVVRGSPVTHVSLRYPLGEDEALVFIDHLLASSKNITHLSVSFPPNIPSSLEVFTTLLASLPHLEYLDVIWSTRLEPDYLGILGVSSSRNQIVTALRALPNLRILHWAGGSGVLTLEQEVKSAAMNSMLGLGEILFGEDPLKPVRCITRVDAQDEWMAVVRYRNPSPFGPRFV